MCVYVCVCAYRCRAQRPIVQRPQGERRKKERMKKRRRKRKKERERRGVPLIFFPKGAPASSTAAPSSLPPFLKTTARRRAEHGDARDAVEQRDGRGKASEKREGEGGNVCGVFGERDEL